MVKVTVNTTRSSSGNILSKRLETPPPPATDPFMFSIQEFAPNLHAFRAQDRDHHLLCEMTLEVKETLVSLDEEGSDVTYMAPVVAGSFPPISLQKLNEKISFDSYLQGIVMFQFQLKVLEQLLLFCEEMEAVNLILTINDTELDYLEVYSRFFTSEERVATPKGAQTEIVIPTDVDTYDEVIDFMDKMDRDFRKILWREQNINPTFREYLKSNACL